MSQIEVIKNPNGIEGLAVIKPTVHRDSRGYFVETYNQKEMEEAGLFLTFVQDNQSKSYKGVLRGLHFQKNYPQGKLVRVIQGAVYDVAVDLRKNSPTYGSYYGIILTDTNFLQFFIPKGFAHGFLVLSDEAVFAYKCTDYYHPNDEGGLAWDDPDIGIKWPLDGIEKVKLSEKDKANPILKKIETSGFKFMF
ncbi:MAG: dTDP-4-dehydrorhamnose 3,5-epimerase [Clostridiaceae bacterium]|jgi:dTDP-4-dehydrorhamnose 3,5-epimerase|nr:dTDP-4-dehydrorhamnose 3,5-epimerase [Clostridiaceae bacterium]